MMQVIDMKKQSPADMARRFSVAPMMDWTTRDYRAFARTLTKRALLYTEMVTTGAVLHGSPRERFLGYSEVEHPIALQLGAAMRVSWRSAQRLRRRGAMMRST
ncbi:hypothetical protein HAALTHF_48130n [Vreelandella aquamarina]|nr:hypothetical protein HAALTHF_48130n [Halomonas axialensis]